MKIKLVPGGSRRSAATARLLPLALGVLGLLAATFVIAVADELADKLPAGPIRDRHIMMEGVGDAAKAIGGASKAGKPQDAVAPAEKIAAALEKLPTMFPPGSTSPLSRAKPEVWTDKAKFDQLAKAGREKALALAQVAKSGGDLKAPSAALFQSCKACHTDFRVPKEGE